MKNFLYRHVAPLLPVALLSYGLSWSFHLVLFTPQSLLVRALWVVLFTVLFDRWFRSYKTFLAGIALLTVGFLAVWWFNRYTIFAVTGDFFTQAGRFLTGGGTMASRYIPVLTLLSTILATLLVSIPGRAGFSFPALFILSAGLLLTEWLFGHDQILPVVIPVSVALLMMLAKSHQRQISRVYHKAMPENPMALWTLPAALIIVVICYLGLMGESAGQWKWKWLVNRVEVVNDYLSDYTGFSRPRNSFSLSATGFSPYPGRLGGPVAPDDTEVLWVATRQPLLLRGNTYNYYYGQQWGDTTDSDRYRIGALTNRSALEDTFDQARPDAPGLMDGTLERFMIKTDLTVVHLTQGSSSMFTPFRVTTVTPTKRFELVVYFNDKGDIFTTRDITPGSGYTISAILPDYEDPDFPQLMARLFTEVRRDSEDKYDRIRQLYMNLPSDVDPQIYEITAQLTAGAANDYEKMIIIKQYLASAFQYTLTPPVPPDSEFVSWFFASREGYCTYFATAMAVMARIAGLPSRYVEGYIVVPERSGECTVTNQSAHAWTEIYFNGIGWIPFDATPLGGDEPPTGNGSSQNGGELFPEITPESTPGSSGTVPLPPASPAGKNIPLRITLSVLGLAAALLLALTTLSRLRTSPWMIRRRRPTLEGQASFLFGDILALLEFFNTPVKTGETLYAYADRVDRWLTLGKGSLRQIADIVVRMTYSGKQPTVEEIMTLARFRYLLARHTLRLVGPFRYFRDRVLRVPLRDRLP